MAWSLDVAVLTSTYQDTASTTVATNTLSAVAAGALIVLCISNRTNADVITVSSVAGGGLTWNLVGNIVTGVHDRVTMAYALAPSGLASGTTITVTYSGSASQGRGLMASSYLGADQTTPYSNNFLTTKGTGTSYYMVLNATAVAIPLVIVAASHWGGAVHTPIPSMVEDTELTGQILTRRFETSPGFYNVGGTWASALEDVEVAAVFNGDTGSAPKTGWYTG